MVSRVGAYGANAAAPVVAAASKRARSVGDMERVVKRSAVTDAAYSGLEQLNGNS